MKTLEWWGSRGYLWDPVVSFILHTHNMSSRTIAIVNELRKFDKAEIIVIDDGSDPEHTLHLAENMTGVNEFLVRANDLFDVIVFNRTIGFARGEYIAIIQDDDDYIGNQWVSSAVRIFRKDPKIAVIGGRALIWINKDGVPVAVGNGEDRYAPMINAAPMWVRKSQFLDLGGFDRELAPNFWHEPALCMEAWLNGYKVYWYKSGVDILAVNTDSRRAKKKQIEEETRSRNLAIFLKRYRGQLDKVYAMVSRENA